MSMYKSLNSQSGDFFEKGSGEPERITCTFIPIEANEMSSAGQS